MRVGEVWQRIGDDKLLIKLIKRNAERDSYYFICSIIESGERLIVINVDEMDRMEIALNFVKIKDEGYFEETLNNPVSRKVIKEDCNWRDE